MSEAQKLYKVLINGKSCHGGDMVWSLPIENVLEGGYFPGNWHRVTGKLEPCYNGLHVCTWDQAWQSWMKIDADIYEVETHGKIIHNDSKSVARSVRLMKPVELPDWWIKTRAEIMTFKDVKWLHPDGNPLPEWKLFTADSWAAATAAATAAARSAARFAALGAAWDVARSAATAAARFAALGAALGAAWDVATDAARAAARFAARSVAWGAARFAALETARAAETAAARSAAWDVAWDVALGAATDAALNTSLNVIFADLSIDLIHREYAQKRWQAWQKGYAVLCDVGGQLYVYAKE